MRTAVLVAFALSGCATTPEGIRQDEPKAVFHSAKTSAELEQCFAESKLARLGSPSVVHGPQRSSISFGGGGITRLLIDIEPPVVTVRAPLGFAPAARHWIEACL